MTVFRIRFLSALAALCLLADPALAADDTDNFGGTFTTPGYPQRSSPMQGGAGGAQGLGNPQQPPNGANPRLPFGTGGSNLDNANNGNDNGASGNRALRPNEVYPSRIPRRAPPKPSEFQKFVESATGRLLPLFGSTFFADAADTANPVDNVPVSADYTVGPGDEIILRAWGSIDVDYRTTVDRNGMLNLPKIGSFNVAGVKASELEQHLRAQIGRLYTNFNLSVALGQLRSVKVFVVGPAQRPGVYTLPSQSTLLSALVAAGGPAPNGSMRHVTLRRDGRAISELDVYEFLVQGDKSKDMQLAAGDVVVFQPAGPQVALTGAVDTRAIYELKNAQEPLRDVLRYAGGAPVLANPNKVQLERIDPTQAGAARFVDEFPLDAAGLAKPLRDGDVLTLLAISPQFANAVTLKGHVAQPLRYPYKPGMRIRDLIPDREALISPDFYRRKNLLVQVIEDDDDNYAHRARRRADQELLRNDPNVVGRNDRSERGDRSDFTRNRDLLPDDSTRSVRRGSADRETDATRERTRTSDERSRFDE
ncbi:MAG: SLBB domain-containing protein, partial [Caldimonas sp.]